MSARWNLSDISKKPAVAAQVAAQYVQVGPPQPIVPSVTTTAVWPNLEPAIDQTPVYIPSALLRHILDNWAGAFYVAETETQRRKVVDNAIKALAQLTPNQIQRRELIPDPDGAKLEGSHSPGPH